MKKTSSAWQLNARTKALALVAVIMVAAAGVVVYDQAHQSNADYLVSDSNGTYTTSAQAIASLRTVLTNLGMNTTSLSDAEVVAKMGDIARLLQRFDVSYGSALQTRYQNLQQDTSWKGTLNQTLLNRYFGVIFQVMGSEVGSANTVLSDATTNARALADYSASPSPSASTYTDSDANPTPTPTASPEGSPVARQAVASPQVINLGNLTVVTNPGTNDYFPNNNTTITYSNLPPMHTGNYNDGTKAVVMENGDNSVVPGVFLTPNGGIVVGAGFTGMSGKPQGYAGIGYGHGGVNISGGITFHF